MITDNEGVSNKMDEDSCCVSVGVICDIVSVDTSGSVTLVDNNTVNGVAEGVSVSLTRKTNDEDTCWVSVGIGTVDWVVILGKNDVVNTDTESVSDTSVEVIKVVENSC